VANRIMLLTKSGAEVCDGNYDRFMELRG